MARRRRTARRYRKPPLTVPQILAWADDYKLRIGRWPHHFSGRIRWSEETWLGIDGALRSGYRGLSGGSSPAHLLFVHRNIRSPGNLPPLDEKEILRWARAHFKRTEHWPSLNSGAILEAPGESWNAVDLALSRGTRGLGGGTSVAQLLAAHGLKRNLQQQPPLTSKQILTWADAFFKRHGFWPFWHSGQIAESPNDTWSSVDKALLFGRRGLAKERSLAAFLNKHRNLFRGKSRRPKHIPDSERLRIVTIVGWAKAHHRRTGRWPNRDSGPIVGVSGESWLAVDSALKRGCRGLPGGSSLVKLLKAHCR